MPQPSAQPPGLSRLNAMPRAEAAGVLLAICGSKRWVAEITSGRPYSNFAALLSAADKVWFSLSKDDWLEAFSHHPRIGETNLTQTRFSHTAAQSGREQSGMAGASEEVRAAFAAGNAEYERRFGHVFLICATGKSGEFMLEQLHARLANDAPTELANASREQSMIVRLRLEKLVHQP